MIISDSTTLIVLLELDKLEYLSNIFKKIIIPYAVYKEVNYKNSFDLPPFIEIAKPSNLEFVEELMFHLDIGESEATALSIEKNLPLIIDEKKGRKIAINLNIKIVGLLGIIYLNIKKGYISQNEAKEFLNSAINRGYRISNKLVSDMFYSL